MDAGSLSLGLVNSHWYRVAGLSPHLRGQLPIHAQHYRGQLWYVVEDRFNGKYHRFDHRAYRIIRLLDGSRTLQELWQRLASEAEEETPSQEDILLLLGQLHGLDLLAGDTLPDLVELEQRGQRQSRQQRWSRYLNPLALRIPLLDPDRLLARLVKVLAPLLNGRGALLWLAWVLPALPLAGAHWSELTSNFGERLLALDNLVLLGLAFPVVKAFHELGHGLACKLRGGEVHDMGVMLLVFLPVPYVEASSSWTFVSKRDRMLVGAAGMLVEIALAALALYLWLWLEPGTAKAIAYNVAVLASVTTVVFNGNPLLRYDGYYILSDALEIPNLAQRATRYWGYLLERYVLRQHKALSPAMAPGEAFWFTVYAPLAFVYRLFVLFSIAVFVSAKFLAVGVVIALWSLVTVILVPLYRGGAWLAHTLGAQDVATGARRNVLVLAAAALVVLLAVPVPHHTQVDGVLWLPDDTVLRAGQAGFVEQVAAQSNGRVQSGDVAVRLADPGLAARLAVQAARTEEARIRYDAVRLTDPVAGEQLAPELARESAELDHLRERAGLLAVRSHAAGHVWLNDVDDLPGRYVAQGQILGYVIPPSAPHVRAIVEQSDEDFIRSHTRAILVRVPCDPGRSWQAKVVREVPAASTELPSAALGQQGGGGVPTDPRDQSGRKALISLFEYELALPANFPYHLAGSRASVRFQHPAEPVGFRLWRGVRRLFLAHFHA